MFQDVGPQNLFLIALTTYKCLKSILRTFNYITASTTRILIYLWSFEMPSLDYLTLCSTVKFHQQCRSLLNGFFNLYILFLTIPPKIPVGILAGSKQPKVILGSRQDFRDTEFNLK